LSSSSVVNTNDNIASAATTTTKKGGLFDDLQDLLVDQSTGQKISLTKRFVFESISKKSNQTLFDFKVPFNHRVSIKQKFL